MKIIQPDTPTFPRRRRLAEIPRANPLAHVLGRELLGRVASRKRHGRKHAVTVDYFCGAGGLTTGVERARERLGIPGYHYGINHDVNAIQTISTNHHGTFINSSVESIPVREVVREGYVTLFTGAAECIMHSTARRSDLPIYDQSRTSAAYMLEAIHDLPPEAIILENVPEWERWSVLDPKTLRPVKGREGEYFNAFVKALRDMGYNIEWRMLNACDFGSVTSRKRLFLCGTADDRPILWPVQTHAKNPEKHRGANLLPWRASREIIDWDDLGTSLFARAGGPHAVRSLARMMTGFSQQSATLAGGYAAAIATFIPISHAFHSTRAPKFEFNTEDFKKNPALANYAKIPTKGKKITIASGTERVFISNVWRVMFGLSRASSELTPKERKAILKLGIEQSQSATRVAFARPVATFTIDSEAADVETFALANRVHASAHYTRRDPLPTATTATGGGIAHVAPLILGQHEGGIARNACTDPFPTIATKGAIGAAEPRLIKMNASATSAFGDETRSTDLPLGTLVGKTCIGLSTPALPEPMLSAYYGPKNGRTRAPRPVSEPMGTQSTENRFGLLSAVTPHALTEPDALIVTMNHGGGDNARFSSPDDPLGTLTSKGSNGLVQPFIARQNGFYGEAAPQRAIEPMTDPLSSISAGGQHHALVSPTEPFLFEQRCAGSDDPGIRSVSESIPTITTISRIGLVNGSLQNQAGQIADERDLSQHTNERVTSDRDGVAPFISVNYGERDNQTPRSYSVSEPLRTIVPQKGAGVLVRPGFDVASSIKPWIIVNGVPYAIDILFRMLKVSELAKSMGFITDRHNYTFSGTETDQVRQIGNAVAVEVAEALAMMQLKPIAARYFRRDKQEKIAA